MILPSDFTNERAKQTYDERFDATEMEKIKKIWWDGSKSIEDYQLKIEERIYSFVRSACIFHLIALIFLSVVYLVLMPFATRLLMIFGPILRAIKRCFSNNKYKVASEDVANEETYLENKPRMVHEGMVESYRMQSNPMYLPAYKAVVEVSSSKDQNTDVCSTTDV
jgi:hypothetical protein